MPVAIDIRRALETEGWMGEPELTWLAEAASKSQKILEVGVWCGRSTRALADNCPGVVYAMDIWAGSDWERKADVNSLVTREREEFNKNMADHIANGKVIPLRMDSVTWELGRGQEPIDTSILSDFDLVFLDGLHTYQHLVAEIYLYRPRIKPGGILAGHDYAHPYEFGAEVKRAVDTMLGPVNIVDWIWWTHV